MFLNSGKDATWPPPSGVFQVCPAGRRLRGRPRTSWRGLYLHDGLGIPLSEQVDVAREKDVSGPLQELLPLRPNFE